MSAPDDGGALRAWIVGPGRMGRDIEREWTERGHEVTATVDVEDEWPAENAGADVAFEFTRPEAAERNVERLLERGIPTVCGTTGWDPSAARKEADRRGVPLLVSPNFSVGMMALRAALLAAARRISGVEGYDPGVFERHHRAKEDAPSGTAGLLADELEAVLGRRPEVASLRQGEQPGVHHIFIEGPDEEIRLTHRARSREPFVVGAVEAAEHLARERPAGDVRFADFLDAARSSDG